MKPGGEDRLHQGLAGLEVLAGDRGAGLLRELDHRREVAGEVRRAVAVRDPRLDRAVGVDHRGQDVGVALVEALLELLDRGVNLARLAVHLGRAAPDHHQPVAALLLLEARDVGRDLLGEVALRLALLHVRPVQLLHVLRVEDGRPRLDALEEVLDRLEVARLEDAGLLRRLVGAVRVDVPAAELELVEAGEGHEVLDQRRAVVRALAEPDGAHLRQAADRLGEPAPHRLHAGDERGRHRAHARQKHAELPPAGAISRPLPAVVI